MFAGFGWWIVLEFLSCGIGILLSGVTPNYILIIFSCLLHIKIDHTLILAFYFLSDLYFNNLLLYISDHTLSYGLFAGPESVERGHSHFGVHWLVSKYILSHLHSELI